jgi:NTE family protein
MAGLAVPWVDHADGVFRGGGAKGIAVAGAIQAMYRHPEKPVHSWDRVAGTSAGAIIAAYLACGNSPDAIGDFVAGTPMSSFADFPLRSRVLGGVPNFIARHGFARGKRFVEWADSELTGCKRFGEIGDGDRLKMIAADITNRRMLVIPDDLAGYGEPDSGRPIVPAEFPVSRALRMSMSIPYFFEPVQLLYDGKPATIVDGGTLSNFPVWLFDVQDRPATRPTFGITLKDGRGFGPKLKLPAPFALRLAIDISQTASGAWDAHFQSHSTRVRSFAASAGDVATTQFKLPPEKVSELMENGKRAAHEFLAGFDLSQYMNTFGNHMATASAPPAGVGMTSTVAP